MTRRERYRSDPAYRLARINSARRARGSAPIATLADAYCRQLSASDRQRDAAGRFKLEVPNG